MRGTLLSGKGLWLRRLTDCEQGDPDRIAARAQAAGLTHVILKVADGADPANAEHSAALVNHLTASGITVWGWQAIYGDKPRFKGEFEANYHLREADQALARITTLRPLGLAGYALLAQGDYERAAYRAAKATEFMQTLRAALSDFPLGLASWKNPKSHPRFPWAEFRAHCDLDLPQVFWIAAPGEAAHQLETSVRQFAALTPRRPYSPTGPAFFEDSWRPSPDDLTEFVHTAHTLGLPAVNLFSWDSLALTGAEPTNRKKLDFTPQWQSFADYHWQTPTASPFWISAPAPETAPAPIGVPAPIAEPEQQPPAPPAGAEPELVAASEAVVEYPLEPDENPLVSEPEAEADLPDHLQFLGHPELEDQIELEEPPPATEISPTLELEPELEEPSTPKSRADLPAWLQHELSRADETIPEPDSVGADLVSAPEPIEEYLLDPDEDPIAFALEYASGADLPDHLQFLAHPELETAIELYKSVAPAVEPELIAEAEPSPEAELIAEPEPDSVGADLVSAPEPVAEYPLAPGEELLAFGIDATDAAPDDDLPEHLQFLIHPELADEIELYQPEAVEPEIPAEEPVAFGFIESAPAVNFDFITPPAPADDLRETLLAEPEPAPEYIIEPDEDPFVNFTIQSEPDDALPEHLAFLNNPALEDDIELYEPTPVGADLVSALDVGVGLVPTLGQETIAPPLRFAPPQPRRAFTTSEFDNAPENIFEPEEELDLTSENLFAEPAIAEPDFNPAPIENLVNVLAGADFVHTTAIEIGRGESETRPYELTSEDEVLFASFLTEPEDQLPDHLAFLNDETLVAEMEEVAPLQSELDAMGLEDLLGSPDETDLLREIAREAEIAPPEEVISEPELVLEPVVYDITLEDALELQLEPDDDLPDHLAFLHNPALADEMELIVPPPTIAVEATVTPADIQAVAEQAHALQVTPSLPISAIPDWVVLPEDLSVSTPADEADLVSAIVGEVRPEIAAEVEEALAPEPGLPSDTPLPDWLAEVDTELTRAAEPLPDWLADAEADLIRAEQHGPDALHEPTGESETEPLPDWLADADADLAKAGPIDSVGADLVSAPAPIAEPEAIATPEPEPAPTPIAEPEPISALEPESAPAPIAEPEATAAPQPLAAPESIAPTIPAPADDDLIGQLFYAVRGGELDKALTFYSPTFALVSQKRILRDPAAAREFFQTLTLTPRTLSLLSQRGSRAAITAHWTARRADGAVLEGTDTLHLNREGRIVFHQTTLHDQ